MQVMQVQDASCSGNKYLSFTDYTLVSARRTAHDFMTHAFAPRTCGRQRGTVHYFLLTRSGKAMFDPHGRAGACAACTSGERQG